MSTLLLERPLVSPASPVPLPPGGETVEIGSVAALPLVPGVYLFLDDAGEILYVGKAKRLRRRVRSYFRPRPSLPRKTGVLVSRLRRIEALVVRTEEEALLLEAALIRKHRPRFNQRLKEGRGYPFLRISLGGPVPCAELAGAVRGDSAAYFGPLPATGRVREMLHVVRRLYPTCAAAFERSHPAGPPRMERELLGLVEGNGSALLRRVERALRAAVRALAFERAARLHAALRTCHELRGAPRAGAGASPPPVPQVRERIVLVLPDRNGIA